MVQCSVQLPGKIPESVRAAIATVKTAKNSTVCRKSCTACFFLPSKYSRTGWKQKRYPMTAAERVKSEIIINGIKKVFGRESKVEKKFISATNKAIYPRAATELTRGVLDIVAFSIVSINGNWQVGSKFLFHRTQHKNVYKDDLFLIQDFFLTGRHGNVIILF